MEWSGTYYKSNFIHSSGATWNKKLHDGDVYVGAAQSVSGGSLLILVLLQVFLRNLTLQVLN
jgi:hypothetical protein